MARHIDRVRRIGPFCPPLTQPGYGPFVQRTGLVFSESEAARFGVNLRDVPLEAVKVAIAEDDFGSSEPPFYPDSGEPEDYLEGRCSKRVARAIGFMQQVVFSPFEKDVGATDRFFERVDGSPNCYSTQLSPCDVRMDHPMDVYGIGLGVIVTDQFLQFLESKNALKWLEVTMITIRFDQ